MSTSSIGVLRNAEKAGKRLLNNLFKMAEAHHRRRFYLRFLNVLRSCCLPTKRHIFISQWIIFCKIFRANLTTYTYSRDPKIFCRRFLAFLKTPADSPQIIAPACTELVNNKTPVKKVVVMLCQSCMVINAIIYSEIYIVV
jgi:hypothetical protein